LPSAPAVVPSSEAPRGYPGYPSWNPWDAVK